MKVSGTLLFILILVGFSGPRCGATVYPSNGTAASVQSILNNQAQNGDTITLPAGTFIWTTRVSITKAITLQGAGVGQTIIKDNANNTQLILVTLVAGKLTRITGIEFQDGGRINRGLAPMGILRVVGSNINGSSFRWDHCKWNDLNGFSVFDTVIGVIDHNTFIRNNGGEFMIYVYGTTWDGGGNGDKSWSAPTNYGSSQFLFIEDNTFTSNVAPFSSSATDGLNGCRFVARHNTFFDTEVQNHGTDSGGRERGGRAIEIYNNNFIGSNITASLGGARSGGVLLHDNTISGHQIGPVPAFNLGNWRNFMTFNPWGGADGTNQWDVNEPTVFFTGTAAANSSGRTVTVSGANWTPNHWAGYTIRRTSNVCGSNSVNFAWIKANTLNTITYTDHGGYPIPSLSFCAGDSLEIRKVDHALDQPGRALGSLITGNPPLRPAGWNNQVTEPCYSWNNTTGNGPVNFTPGPGVRANVHFFNNTPMPGYSEYAYPHPLVTGPRAVIADFNGDASPDFQLRRNGTGLTAIWYLNNNVLIDGDPGPTLPTTWTLAGAADFNRDSHTDYALVHPATNYTAICYMSGPTLIGAAWGPRLPSGWELVGAADFNGDSKPDYVLYKASTRQTAIWYLNNNSLIGGDLGPTLPDGWSLVGVADFDRDGHTDYALFKATTGETAIWYLSGPTLIGGAVGPTVPSGWRLVATADFDRDGNPDLLLYNASSYETAIWYLNNNVFVSSASGPTLLAAWGWRSP
jgi:hypothetical protein